MVASTSSSGARITWQSAFFIGGASVGLSHLLRSCIPDFYLLVRMYLISYMVSPACDSDADTGVLNDRSVVYESTVMPASIDRNLHANNAFYVYEANFSRRYALTRLGVWRVLHSNGVNVIVQSQAIRYRRDLKLFDRFRVSTRFVGFDETSFFIETRFIDRNGFICTISFVKYKIIGVSGRKVVTTPSQVLIEAGVIEKCFRPPSNSFINHWQMADACNSKELNPNKL